MESNRVVSLKRVAQSAALRTGLSAKLTRGRNGRAIIMLHGVGDAEMPQADFVTAMRWLKSHFRILSLDAMLCNMQEGRPPETMGEVALTFDDGLRNHAEIAYPVLKALGLPATFFVCPGLIESRQWLWSHEARSRLRRLSDSRRIDLTSVLKAPAPETETIMTWMKSLPLQQRQFAENHIRDATPDFVPTRQERVAYDPLDWEDLRRLDPRLITVGSHTINHPILPTLDNALMHDEMTRSRAWLESELGQPVDLFCYPNGSQDQRAHRLAAQTYRAAVSTLEGHPFPGVDWHAIPRIPVAARLPLLAWRMYRP
ncbi:MAG: polysaccharide deacetylase family protein [Burkholderiales bacterium]|nr:polysaccharide deacetylase family protein [Burkholderiales bacterium]